MHTIREMYVHMYIYILFITTMFHYVFKCSLMNSYMNLLIKKIISRESRKGFI